MSCGSILISSGASASRKYRFFKTCLVKGAVEPVSRAITREHPARTVRAVRSRCQPDDQHSSVGVAERRYGVTPVGVTAEGRTLFDSDLLAPRDKPRTLVALCDPCLQRVDAHTGPSSTCAAPIASIRIMEITSPVAGSAALPVVLPSSTQSGL